MNINTPESKPDTKTLWHTLPNDVHEKIIFERTRLHYADCVNEFMMSAPNDDKGQCLDAIKCKIHTFHDTCVDADDMDPFEHMAHYMYNELSMDYDDDDDNPYLPLLDLLFAGEPSLRKLYFTEKPPKRKLYYDDTPGNWTMYTMSDLQAIRTVLDRFGPDVIFSSWPGEE